MEELKTLPSAVYLDLEWNCADMSRQGDPDPEIVEIGLAELDPISLRVVREANYLVRPRQLDISFHCTSITGLTRDDLLTARPLRDVVTKITEEWPAKATCFAWGTDGQILTRACQAKHLTVPFRRFVDLNRTVQQILLLSEQLSVQHATATFGLSSDGCQHMAVAARLPCTKSPRDPCSGRRVPGRTVRWFRWYEPRAEVLD